MPRTLFSLAILCSLTCFPASLAASEGSSTTRAAIRVAPTDWPWWRGPSRDGVASAAQNPPLNWTEQQNVVWQSAIPGRGHGSPTVVGDQIFLATADHDQQTQLVLCYDRHTGKQLWEAVVHDGGLASKSNAKASQASSTVACDGERLFINFLNRDAIYTTALTRDGKQLWQTKISDYVVHQGYGSSPAVYQDLVIVTADNKGGGAIAALERTSGRVVWKHQRPAKPNYPSPIILPVSGRDQLLLTGCDLVSSFNPLTGEKLWEVEGATTECVTSTVTNGELIFTSGGYPRNHMSAVRADGSGEIVWGNDTKVYVPSMLLKDGYLYAVGDAGVAMCFESKTGKTVWKARLGGDFTASPVLVGERIYATNEDGRTYVFRANPEKLEILAENQLGDEVLATPTIVHSRIHMRVARQQDGRRQESIVCIGHAE